MPGRPASTCWVTSRWSVFSVRRTSCKLRPFSKKTGAERPFRQAGEMWCEQDSKRAKDVDMTASDLEIARADGVVFAASLPLPERSSLHRDPRHVAQSTIVTGP